MEDESFSLKPKEKNFSVNFHKLKKALLSKNEVDLKEIEFIFDKKKGEVFLDGNVDMEEEAEKVCYITFPRVGSTFLRKLLHRITGVQTGADMKAGMTYMQLFYGLKGES